MLNRNAQVGTLVQLVDNSEEYTKAPYTKEEEYVFFAEERPAIVLDYYTQGSVRYYKVMLVYTGEVLGGVPEYLLQPNKLVL